ncbi:hypothetical protein F2Q69_00020098 [Brassica cretica]|uniref:Asparagine synthetase domain-containing protein n=2 Tax=Brassica TaxID=3705 RepID=A0A8S9QAF2_BRACR|nr:hypothetical protein F2Q69_00020098 [Brassica cretica]
MVSSDGILLSLQFDESIQVLIFNGKKCSTYTGRRNSSVMELDSAGLMVSDAMMTITNFVFPDNMPLAKEAYYYRAIFEKLFPKSAARAIVPGGRSVACSTAKAVEWDAAWSRNLYLSGRAALGVHVAAYEEDKAEGTRPEKLQKLVEKTAEAIV